MPKVLDGYRVIKRGKIKEGDRVWIGEWRPAIGAIGADIGTYPWHQTGDVIRPIKSRKSKRVILDSTDHYTIETSAIVNYASDIYTGERRYSHKDSVYLLPVSIKVTGPEWRRLYGVARHIEGDCDEECKYCRVGG